jgi:hypothetical protein
VPNNERRRRINKVVLGVTGSLIFLIVLASIIPSGGKTKSNSGSGSTAVTPDPISQLCVWGKTHRSQLGVGATGGDGSHSYLIVQGAARKFLPNDVTPSTLSAEKSTLVGHTIITLHYGNNLAMNFVDGRFTDCRA